MNLRHSFITLNIFLCILPAFSWAQYPVDTVGPGTYFSKMPNGLSVLLIENQSGLVTCDWVSRYGTFYESPFAFGYGNWVSHMFLQPNAEYIVPEILNDFLNRAGCIAENESGREYCSFRFSTPEMQFPGLLHIWSNLIRNPGLDSDIGKTILKKIQADKTQQEQNPFFALARKTDEVLFDAASYQWNPTGNLVKDENYSIESIRESWTRYFVPGNSLLAVSGPIQMDQLLSLVDSVFGDWMNSESDSPNWNSHSIKNKVILPFLLENELQTNPGMLISYVAEDDSWETEKSIRAVCKLLNFEFSLLRDSILKMARLYDLHASVSVAPGLIRVDLLGFPIPGEAVHAAEFFRKDFSSVNWEHFPDEDEKQSARQLLQNEMAFDEQIYSDYIHDLAIRWARKNFAGIEEWVQDSVIDWDIHNWISFILASSHSTGLMCHPICSAEEGIEKWAESFRKPEPVVVVPIMIADPYSGGSIHFRTGKSMPDSSDFSLLEEAKLFLQENPGSKLLVEGHTDSEGGKEFNLNLSRNRAETVKEMLAIQFKVDEKRISVKAFGETRPLVEENSPEDRYLNRRVTLVPLKSGQTP